MRSTRREPSRPPETRIGRRDPHLGELTRHAVFREFSPARIRHNRGMSKRRFSVVRDPVHGDIYLTREELSLLDTPEMQRLRGIRQLGTAYLIYPGAHHTRFEHSI